MLPTYEDTPEKDQGLANGILPKKEAAEYLGIKEEDLLAHVRQGRLQPLNPEDEPWRFRIDSLDNVAAWYDAFRPRRRQVAVVWAILGLILLALGGYGSLCWNCSVQVLARVLFCFGAGGLGLSLRAHRLEREYLSSPFPDYVVSYPFIVLVNSLVLVAVLSYFETTRPDQAFLILAFPLGVVLALFAHPDHWIIPQWIRQGRVPGK